MKNNQFKKEIRKLIENKCRIYNYNSIAIDKNSNKRMIYIYNSEYTFVGLFSFWFGDEEIHLEFTNKDIPLILHTIKGLNVKYTEFNSIVFCTDYCFEIMAGKEC